MRFLAAVVMVLCRGWAPAADRWVLFLQRKNNMPRSRRDLHDAADAVYAAQTEN